MTDLRRDEIDRRAVDTARVLAADAVERFQETVAAALDRARVDS